jgi:hypothetical protein
MGIAAVAHRGKMMRESFAASSVQPSLGERFELLANRLEIVAWLGLFGLACFAGFLLIAA